MLRRMEPPLPCSCCVGGCLPTWKLPMERPAEGGWALPCSPGDVPSLRPEKKRPEL